MSESAALMRLQKIDLELLKANSTLAAMPQLKRLKTIQLAQKKLSLELNRIIGLRKDAELEIEDLEGRRKEHVQKTAEIQAAAATESDYRILSDYDHKLTSLAKAIEKVDFKLTGARENLQKLQKVEAGAYKMQRKLTDELETVTSSLSTDTTVLQDCVNSLKSDREMVAAQLSQPILDAYEKARKRFKGLAVEYLDGNMPSTCRVKLQPSSFHDLAHGEAITECPYCHRMLVTDYALEEECAQS